jgi:Flp pilus assembly protein TadB
MSLLASTSVAAAIILWLAPFASNRPRRVARRPESVDARPMRRIDRALRWRRHRRTDIGPAAVADWADHLARSLRHGTTLHAALSTIHPVDAGLAVHCEPLHHWLSRGASVVDACDEWSDHLAHHHRRGTDLLTTTAAVLAAVAMLGGTAAEPLDRLAVTMRQHVSDDLERNAHAAQAQMSARVLTVVPVAVLVLLLLTDDDVRSVVTRPTGLAVVVGGLTINTIGAVWMRHIASGGIPSTSPRPNKASGT